MSDPIQIDAQVFTDGARKLFADAGSSIRDRLRRALLGGGQAIAQDARALAPRKSGDLAAGIQARLVETESSIATVVKASAFYALFLDRGVVRHGTKNNKRGKGGKRVRGAARKVLAGAGIWRIKPRLFMEGARDRQQARILDSLRDAVNAGVADAQGST